MGCLISVDTAVITHHFSVNFFQLQLEINTVDLKLKMPFYSIVLRTDRQFVL